MVFTNEEWLKEVTNSSSYWKPNWATLSKKENLLEKHLYLSTSKNLTMLEQLGLTHLTQAPILSLFLFKILDSLENVMILSLVKSFPVSY